MSSHFEETARGILNFPDDQTTSGYRDRGRRYEKLTPDNLRKAWVAAFRAWLAHSSFENDARMDDLAAELHLRELGLPVELVPSEMTRLRAEVDLEDDDLGEFEEEAAD